MVKSRHLNNKPIMISLQIPQFRENDWVSVEISFDPQSQVNVNYYKDLIQNIVEITSKNQFTLGPMSMAITLGGGSFKGTYKIEKSSNWLTYSSATTFLQIPQFREGDELDVKIAFDPENQVTVDYYEDLVQKIVETASNGEFTLGPVSMAVTLNGSSFGAIFNIAKNKQWKGHPERKTTTPKANVVSGVSGITTPKTTVVSGVSGITTQKTTGNSASLISGLSGSNEPLIEVPIEITTPVEPWTRKTISFHNVPFERTEHYRRSVNAALEEACKGVCDFFINGVKYQNGELSIEYIISPLN